MAANFKVTPELLEKQAGTVETQNSQYVQIYQKVYSEKETMQRMWSGEANQAYCAQLEGFRNDFENLSALLKNYTDYIRQTAKQYRDTDQKLRDEAKQKLSMGK